MSLGHVSSDITMPCPLGLGSRLLSAHLPLTGQIVPEVPPQPPRELLGPQHRPCPLLRSGGGSGAPDTQPPYPSWSPLDLDEEQASEQGKA